VYAAVNGHLAAVLCIVDPPKPEARGVVSELQRQGVHCCMVTGDNARTAHAVAAQLGITSVYAQVLPAGKSEKVRQHASISSGDRGTMSGAADVSNCKRWH
jgi:P-type E1-E2 ATPase